MKRFETNPALMHKDMTLFQASGKGDISDVNDKLHADMMSFPIDINAGQKAKGMGTLVNDANVEDMIKFLTETLGWEHAK